MEIRLEFQSYLTWLIGTSEYNTVLQTYNDFTLASSHIKSLLPWIEFIDSKALITYITGLIHFLAHKVWWWDTLHILFPIDGGFQFYRTIIHMPCIYFSKDSVCCVWSNVYELSWQTVWCTHSSSYFCVYYHSCFASGAINYKTLMGAKTGGFTSRYIILCIFTEFLSIKPLPCQETLHHSDTGRNGDKRLPLSQSFIKKKPHVQCVLHDMYIALMLFFCGYIINVWILVIHLPISLRIDLLALTHIYDSSSASEVALKDMGKINWCSTTAKHNKALNWRSIFVEMYFIF